MCLRGALQGIYRLSRSNNNFTMSKKQNRMATHAVEAMGLRTIAMYVQEYYHWGWQAYGQENDNGLDGEIIPRHKNGDDKGVRIFVQSKAGKGYLSSRNDKTINVSPYSSKESLCQHVDRWNKFREPVLLIYTNAEKTDKDGKVYDDKKNPTAWWMRMDDYNHDGSSVIRIPVENLFQEHTKGALEQMIKPFVNDWYHYPLIEPTKEQLKLWYAEDLKISAKDFFKQWGTQNQKVIYKGKEYPVKISRTGWHHITNAKRKERVQISKRLLPIAMEILNQSQEIRPVELRTNYPNDALTWAATVEHIGYRARVRIENVERKVQVVLKRYRNITHNKEKWWFYSVHIVR